MQWLIDILVLFGALGVAIVGLLLADMWHRS